MGYVRLLLLATFLSGVAQAQTPSFSSFNTNDFLIRGTGVSRQLWLNPARFDTNVFRYSDGGAGDTAGSVLTLATNVFGDTIYVNNEYIYNTIVASNGVFGNISGTLGTIMMFTPNGFSAGDSSLRQTSPGTLVLDGTDSGTITLNSTGVGNPTINFGSTNTYLYSDGTNLKLINTNSTAFIVTDSTAGTTVSIGVNSLGSTFGSSTVFAQLENSADGIVLTNHVLTPKGWMELGSIDRPWADFFLGTNSLFGIYTDDGTQLLRDGIPIGGGGGTNYLIFDGTTLSPTPDGFSQVALTTNSFYIRDVGDNSAMGVTGVTIGGSSVLGVGNGLATINVYAPSGDNYFYADVQDDSSTLNVGIATGNSLDGFGSFLFMPDTTNANANVYFETSGRSSGNLMRVMNASTQALALSWDGAITTGDPSGGTSALAKIGLTGSVPTLDLNGTPYFLTTGGGANYWTYNGSTVSNNVGRVRLYGATTNTGTLLSEGQITSLGIITTASEFDLPPGGSILFSNQLVLASSSAGILRINKSSGVAPAGIAFTAIAPTNPLILQNSSNLWFMVADQTDWTGLKARSLVTTEGITNGWQVITNSSTSTTPMTINASAGQSAAVVQANVGGSGVLTLSSVGSLGILSGTVTNNIGAILAVGNTGYVDVTKASQTNAVAGTLTLVYATNGVDLVDYTAVRWLFNGSGSDQTLAIPSGWRTNVYSAVPPKLTNSTITKMILSCNGPTSSAALQTNCYVSFEYFK